jgi:hypothetical protein
MTTRLENIQAAMHTPYDASVPLTDNDVKKGNLYSSLFKAFAVIERIKNAQETAEAAETFAGEAEDALDAIKALEYHTTQQFFLVADDETVTPFVPNNVTGVLSESAYYRIVAPTSALGTITAQFKDGEGNAVTEVLVIDGAAAGPFVLDDAGVFVNGLFLHVVSDDDDATQGTGLRATAVYTVTHP